MFLLIFCITLGNMDEGHRSLSPDTFGVSHLPSLSDVVIAYPTPEGHKYLLDVKDGRMNAVEVHDILVLVLCSEVS